MTNYAIKSERVHTINQLLKAYAMFEKEKIIELIHQYDIDTQEELASRLNEAGFKVTQTMKTRLHRASAATESHLQDTGFIMLS